MVLAGIHMILRTDRSITVVGDACTVAQAMELTTRLHPKMVLLELTFPEYEVLTFIADVQKSGQNPVVLILCDLRTSALASKAVLAGAAGIVLTVQPPSVFLATVRSMACANAPITPQQADPAYLTTAHCGGTVRQI